MSGGTDVSLLENLAGQMEICCLSDLRYVDQSRLAACLQAIPLERYSLWEWADAVRYLVREEGSFSSRGEAKAFLLRTLEAS